MKTVARLVLALVILASTLRLTVPVSRGAPTSEVAIVVPCTSFGVANYIPYGTISANYGWSLLANGISDYWVTANPDTVDLVVFLMPARPAATQDIALTVTSPSGATVYSTSWKKQKITSYEGTWYWVYAKGNYSEPGIYTVTVFADGARIGGIPLVFTKASH